METIPLTHAQHRIVANWIVKTYPNTRRPELRSLTKSILGYRTRGSGVVVEMTEEDIDTAIGIFETYQREHPSSAVATNCLRFLVNDSKTARKIYDERRAGADVPRETSVGE